MIDRFQKIGIYGLGITGSSVVGFLSERDQGNILCWDDSAQAREKFLKLHPNLAVAEISNNSWKGLDVIFVSPGIPASADVFGFARKHNIEILSDIDLFFLSNKAKNSKIIAVTGTNGKTTVCSMIAHILRLCGLDVHLGGNIGNPVLDLPAGRDFYVLELSSYQLSLVKYLKTDISVLLNVSEDHLSYHGNMAGYVRAKEKIFRLLKKSGSGFIGCADEYCKKIAKKYPNDVSQVEHGLLKNYPDSVIGDHNKYNVDIAFRVSASLGIGDREIIDTLHSYKLPAHRIEFIREKSGVKFYNDSKATNAAAAAKALDALDNIFWIAGGVAKTDRFDEILPFLSKVKACYIFGQDREIIVSFLKSYSKLHVYEADTMQQAFALATKNALSCNISPKTILFSPACASFDQFKNYEDRGNQFKKLCRDLA